MKNTNLDIFKKLSFLRGMIPAENLATALFIVLKVKKEANKPDDTNDVLYDCSRYICNKYNCANVFETSNIFLTLGKLRYFISRLKSVLSKTPTNPIFLIKLSFQYIVY